MFANNTIDLLSIVKIETILLQWCKGIESPRKEVIARLSQRQKGKTLFIVECKQFSQPGDQDFAKQS
jgi:hypothetical protein